MTNERRYDIDWLRVIAIGLLLIYHIAIVFQPWALFIGFMRSDEQLLGLWTPMTLLNVWRIPLLFFVSGMGVFFAMRKRNVKQLLLERARRILFPYLFGIVAIVPLHFLIFQDYYDQTLTYVAHPAHLWFLGNLTIYISILFPLFYYLVRTTGSAFHRGLAKLMSSPVGPLTLTIFFVAEVLIVKPQVFALYAQTAHGYFIGFLGFFFGFLLVYIGKPFWNTMLNWRYFYLGLAVLLFLNRLWIFNNAAPNYLMAVESVVWIYTLFGFAHKHLNHPSKALKYLSKAVYPVYIIHMAVLYAAAYVILPLQIPATAQFLLIVLITGIGCIGIYELVLKRVPFLGNAFGMMNKSRKPVQKLETAEL